MKKFALAFAALCCLLFAACVTVSHSTMLNGLLRSEGGQYFILVGDQTNPNGKFYLVKNENAPEAWTALEDNVGKYVTVGGFVSEKNESGSNAVSVIEVRNRDEP